MDETSTSQFNGTQQSNILSAQQTTSSAAKPIVVIIPVAAFIVSGAFAFVLVHDLTSHGYKFSTHLGKNGFDFAASPTKFTIPTAA